MNYDRSIVPFSSLDVEHLKHYYTYYTSDIHDLNMTNLLIWRKKHDLHWTSIGGYLWYVYTPSDPFNVIFSEPVGDYRDIEALKNAVRLWLQYCDTHGIPRRFRLVGEAFKQILEDMNLIENMIAVEDNFDYCYETTSLATLSGNRYHKKKNHLNQFVKKYEGAYAIQSISEENALDAFQAAKKWCIANGCGEDLDLCFEYNGIQEILNHWAFYQSIGLEGVVIYVDDSPVALTFGEFIPNDTFLVHIEKADQTVQGIYTAINHAMANQVIGRCQTLNREQDMGIEGIRKAKQSYHPSHLVSKYNVNIKST